MARDCKPNRIIRISAPCDLSTPAIFKLMHYRSVGSIGFLLSLLTGCENDLLGILAVVVGNRVDDSKIEENGRSDDLASHSTRNTLDIVFSVVTAPETQHVIGSADVDCLGRVDRPCPSLVLRRALQGDINASSGDEVNGLIRIIGEGGATVSDRDEGKRDDKPDGLHVSLILVHDNSFLSWVEPRPLQRAGLSCERVDYRLLA